MFDTLSPASGFLLELASCADLRSFAGFEPPGGDLVDISVGGLTVMADQNDLGIVASRLAHERHHGARARVPDDLELPDRAIGEPYLVNVEIDHASGVHPT